MKKIKLINNFHNTEANIIVRDDGTISKSAGNRALKKLCGMEDCCCGGVRGGEYSLFPLDWMGKSEFLIEGLD